VAKLRALAENLPDRESSSALKALLARLEGAIARAETEASPAAWKATVEQAVAKSGLFREARLALIEGRLQPLEDLKSLLLELKQWLGLSVKDLPEIESGKEALRQLTRGAGPHEQSQLFRCEPRRLSGTYGSSAPFWMEGGWILQSGRKKREKKKGEAVPLRRPDSFVRGALR
jgi:hypothetical protein